MSLAIIYVSVNLEFRIFFYLPLLLQQYIPSVLSDHMSGLLTSMYCYSIA